MRTDGPCGTGDLIEDPVPFVSNANLGRLARGNYQVAFDPDTRPGPALRAASLRMKSFAVSAAPVGQVDTFNYASISNAATADVHKVGSRIELTLSGTLSTRCARIKLPIEVKRLDDVFVVLPIVKSVHGRGDCALEREGFEIQVDLGTPEPGQYLAHVRSRNGRAVQRIFDVVGTP